VLDPEKRMTVNQALAHPFITGKWTMLLIFWLQKCCCARFCTLWPNSFRYLIIAHYLYLMCSGLWALSSFWHGWSQNWWYVVSSTLYRRVHFSGVLVLL
jgi:predicted membrane channel-forming protein YqfA (hemolysin III family)